MLRIAAFMVVIGGTLAAGPAAAQFGIFDNSPPRPPADVPNGGFPPQPPPVQYPAAAISAAATTISGAAVLSAAAGQPTAANRRAGAVRHPGAAIAAAARRDCRAPRQAAPAGTAADPGRAHLRRRRPIRRRRSRPIRHRSPDDTVVTETPTQKIENGRAVFAGLDKITGRTISFDAAIGETVQFGALQVTARACYTRPPTEATNTDAFVEVDEVTLAGRNQAHLHRLDVCGEPGPACGRASDLRRLADRLRGPGRRCRWRNRHRRLPPPAPRRPVRRRAARQPGAGSASTASPAAPPPAAPAPRRSPTTDAISLPCRCLSAAAPATGRSSGKRAEIGFADQRGVEQLVIGRPRHFDGAERRK